MLKINVKKVIVLILLITGVCVLKYPYILPEEDSNLFIKQALIYWGDNQYVNLVWFLPFLIIFYYSTHDICIRLECFEMRLKNRKRYIVYLLKTYMLYSIFISCITIFLQICILAIITRIHIVTIPWLFLIHYVLDMLFSTVTIVLLYLLFKNYIYAYIIFVCSILFFLILAKNNSVVPIVSLFSKGKINIVSIVLTIVNMYFIYKLYFYYNIGGAKYEIRS